MNQTAQYLVAGFENALLRVEDARVDFVLYLAKHAEELTSFWNATRHLSLVIHVTRIPAGSLSNCASMVNRQPFDHSIRQSRSYCSVVRRKSPRYSPSTSARTRVSAVPNSRLTITHIRFILFPSLPEHIQQQIMLGSHGVYLGSSRLLPFASVLAVVVDAFCVRTTLRERSPLIASKTSCESHPQSFYHQYYPPQTETHPSTLLEER